MSEAFDAYRTTYEDIVEKSIAFTGLRHDIFLRAKIFVLAGLFAERLGGAKPAVLDVGCGVGRMHPLLAPIVGTLSGTDVSGEAIARARGDNAGVDYRRSTAAMLPWPPASFDVALAVCVLHHVPPAARDAFVAEMRRVTRPGGLVVLIEHNPWNPLTRLAVARCPFDADAVLLPASAAHLLLQKAALERVASRHFLFLPAANASVARLETHLRRLPLGAQYAAVGEVKG